jgi:hypothetical protein
MSTAHPSANTGEAARAAVQRAVSRGAVLPKDRRTQDALISMATRDEGMISAIDGLQGMVPCLAGRITPRRARRAALPEACAEHEKP